MDYGRAIRIVRAAHGLKQSELAERLSVGASHLSLIEAGKRNPSLSALQEISAKLRVPLHLLTLLASDPSEFDDPKNASRVLDVAKAFLRLLAPPKSSAGVPRRKRRQTA
jgi:transcriptional regulator with XRE-family HTH domain